MSVVQYMSGMAENVGVARRSRWNPFAMLFPFKRYFLMYADDDDDDVGRFQGINFPQNVRDLIEFEGNWV